MAATQSGTFSIQEFTDLGDLLIGGRLYTYTFGTTALKTAYTDAAGAVPQTYTADGIGGQYIALNARGELPAPLYLAAGSYDIALKRSDGSTVWTRRADPIGDGNAALAIDLASTALATKNSGQVGNNPLLNYAVNTIGWADQLRGFELDWFYQTVDGADYAPAFARAATALNLLVGASYADSMGQAPFGYGVSRRLKLAGRKYPINSTLTLSGDISIFAESGGFYAGATFPAANYMIDTGANPYGGRINDLVVDGSDKNVKGVRIQNAHFTRWKGLSVVSCRNDGIVYEGGAEFFLDGFEVSGSATPNAATVAGLRALGSDAHFINGVIKYTPVGVAMNGGGNNEYIAVHTWGLYAAFKQYVGFWAVNSVRNSFVGCYADSPAKQDYLQAVTVTLNGIPNGGVGWVFDANSTQNQISGGSRAYINTTAWSAFAAAWSGATAYTAGQLVVSGGTTYVCILANTNQAPPNATYWTATTTNQFYAVYCAAQFTQVTGLVYNYAGNWLGDVLFDSNTTRDACLLVGTPTSANGFRPAVLAQVADSGGGATGFIVQNSNSAFATSEARMTLKVGSGTDTASISGVFGTAGASYMAGSVLGSEHWRYSALKYTYSGGNAAEGDQSCIWNDGVGSFAMLALYRNNGGGSPNAAAAVAKFGNINSNSRSINAAGTVNASGADYAEYMRKRDDCGVLAKGQVCGVDADGLLTDKWTLAHSFVVKSTDPSYVGGDTWGTPEAVGLTQPIAPLEPQPVVLPDDATGEQKQAAWEAAEVEWEAYAAALEIFNQQTAALNAAVEAARAHVDRIAFCGQVPATVTGPFAVGDYVIPAQEGDGVQAIAVTSPTFEQYRASVGRVWAVRNARAWISVKVA